MKTTRVPCYLKYGSVIQVVHADDMTAYDFLITDRIEADDPKVKHRATGDVIEAFLQINFRGRNLKSFSMQCLTLPHNLKK